MHDVFTKPVDEITAGDLQTLVDEQIPESDLLEYKSELPCKKNKGPDVWMERQRAIGDNAKNVILEAVVAFANANGGMLLLGVAEPGGVKDVAGSIQPLPQCNDLAKRFQSIFQRCVDPILPMLEIRAVLTEDASGVVVFRVAKSRLAPHRVTRTRKCTIRRSTSCEEMTMTEIHDLTLNINRGLEAVTRKLVLRKERFEREFDRLKTPEAAFGFRVTGLPIDQRTFVQKVHDRGNIVPKYSLPRRETDPHRRSDLEVRRWIEEIETMICRPKLRGARQQSHAFVKPVDDSVYAEVFEDGLLEIGFVCGELTKSRKKLNFNPDWTLEIFAHILAWSRKFRHNAESLGSEYAIEAEIRVKCDELRLGANVYPEANIEAMRRKQLNIDDRVEDVVFPQYSFGANDELNYLLELFQRDVYEHLGLEVPLDKQNQTIEDFVD